jgi:pimeloyl-ACP methyl ester carboxylesterase
MDDIRAVMDAVGSERAALLGFSEGAALSALFAASHPERTIGLILCDGVAVGPLADDPIAESWREPALRIRDTLDRWGRARRCTGSPPRLPTGECRSAFGRVRAGLDEPWHGGLAVGDHHAPGRPERAMRKIPAASGRSLGGGRGHSV